MRIGISLVTNAFVSQLLSSAEAGGHYEPRGRYMAKDKEKWIGIDNTTGDAWTEEFSDAAACLAWLRGEE